MYLHLNFFEENNPATRELKLIIDTTMAYEYFLDELMEFAKRLINSIVN